MRKILTFLVVFILMVQVLVNAQPFGNEWINYSQPYIKIKVVKSGIYRIPFSVLNSAFSGVSGVPSSRFVMYNNGVEVPLFASNSGTLGSSDYLEFYGEKNDGRKETELYKDPSNQLHTYYSLFTDTACYYLSINSSSSNLRFTQTLNDLTALPPAESYFMHTVRTIPTNAFSFGRAYNVGGSNIWNSEYDLGEGYTGSDFTSSTTYTLATPNIYTAGPNEAQIYAIIQGKSNTVHRMNVILNSTTIYDTSYVNYQLLRLRVNVPLTGITASNSIRLNPVGLPGPDRNALSMFEIKYPKQFNFENQSVYNFTLPAGPRAYIRMTNFNSRSTNPVLYDLANNLRITGNVTGSVIEYALPASAVERKLYVRSDNSIDYTTVSTFSPVTFTDFSALSAQGDYLILTHPNLFNDGLGNNWVEEYRKYRDISTPTTGRYYARIVDVNDVYEQFGYGVPKSPLAIRNFISYALSNWTIKPNYLFLIGKGREYEDMRTGGAAYNQCLVPTFGNPGSDMMLASTNASYTPRVNIGRLSVESGTEVKTYLEKVTEYEANQRKTGDPYQTIDDKLWMKEVLHLGGGSDAGERTAFSGYLKSFENIIERDFYGADVTNLFKTSTAPIDLGIVEQIKSRIDSGVSLMTFFGHSAPGTFDISIDEPENYNNRGKYPFFYSNGCFAGYIFNPDKGISERFVLANRKGAIAFLSTTGLSLSTSLNVFGTNFYNNLSKTNYGGSFGSHVKKSVDAIERSSTTSIYDEMIAHEMTLHGDPALTFNQFAYPDYQISASNVYFNPLVITASLDSFEVNVIIHNLGKAIVDSYNVRLTRYFPDGSTADYVLRTNACFYRDTVTFKIPTFMGLIGLGLNQFSIFVDSDNEIEDELSETNNYILNSDLTLLIQSEDILPIYPSEFSIVPKQPILYKASTVNPFAAPRWYVMELDTTELFNSPVKQVIRKYQGGGVVTFDPVLTYRDSIVYYWRVSQDSTSPGSSYSWHTSSFVYISNEYPGWNQSHYYQWIKDMYSNTSMDADRTLRFSNDIKQIEVWTAKTNDIGGPIPWERVEWRINGSNQYRARMMGCGGRNGLNFAVIDPVTGLPWASKVNLSSNYTSEYGNVHCSSKPQDQYGFTFNTIGTHPDFGIPWSQVISNFIDSIPDGYYVLVYSQNDPNYISWDPALRSAILSLGATQVLDLINGTANGPWAFFCKKNTPSYTPLETYKNTFSEVAYLSSNITGRWYQGSFESPLIGPALEWGSVHWRYTSFEPVSTDKQNIDVIGVQSNGLETKLFTTTTLDTIITFVDPAVYPYLKLRFNTEDSTLRTPTQPHYWRVLYREVPEATINPNLVYEKLNDTMQIGNTFQLKLGVESLLDIEMDSLLVKYTLTDASRNTIVSYSREDTLAGLDSMIISYTLPISGSQFSGLNSLY